MMDAVTGFPENSKVSKVRMFLHASQLKNVAGHFQGTSDPYAVVTLVASDPTEKPIVLGKTEVVKNSLSPKWTTHFDLDYEIGHMTRVNVGIYDEPKKAGVHKPMGSALFEVGEILGSRGNTKAKRLRQGGTLFCRVTPAPVEQAGVLHLQLAGVQLKNLEGMFGKSDPFFEVHAKVNVAGGMNWQPVYRSQPRLNDLNPVWEPCQIDLGHLCPGVTGDAVMNRPILVCVWDFHKNGKHLTMGEFETTVNGLVSASLNTPVTSDGNSSSGTSSRRFSRPTPPKFDTSTSFVLQKKGKSYGNVVVAQARIEGVGASGLPTSRPTLQQTQNHGKGSNSSTASSASADSAATPTPTAQESANAPCSPTPKRNKDEPSTPSGLAPASPTPKLNNPKNDSKQNGSLPSSPTPRHSDTHQPSGTTTASTPSRVSQEFASEFSQGLRLNPSPPASPVREVYQPPRQSPLKADPPSAGYMSNQESSGYLDEDAPVFVPLPVLPTATVRPKARPQFVDYLAGGLQLDMIVAIDFTGSNGDPRKPGTLHYVHPDGQLNDYEKALTAVGDIIAKYDKDQLFPCWGFGAKYGGVLQNCFQVGASSHLVGIRGVLEAYRDVFRTGLTMSGPTVFTEIINLAAAQARSQIESMLVKGEQTYSVLLILTDGAVSDVEETKRALQAASDAPLSIIIVGIGNADFSTMRFLDEFQNGGRGIGRDICHFVDFNKFKHNKSALQRETLAELPDQLVDYFCRRNIQPLPPVSGSTMSVASFDSDVDDPDDEDVDLEINVNPDGEISLAKANAAYYDDTQYGTYSAYAPSASAAASAPTAPPFNPAFKEQAAPYQSPQSSVSASAPYNPSAPSAPSPQYEQHPSSRYAYNPRTPEAVAVAVPVDTGSSSYLHSSSPIRVGMAPAAYNSSQPGSTYNAYNPSQSGSTYNVYNPPQPGSTYHAHTLSQSGSTYSAGPSGFSSPQGMYNNQGQSFSGRPAQQYAGAPPPTPQHLQMPQQPSQPAFSQALSGGYPQQHSAYPQSQQQYTQYQQPPPQQQYATQPQQQQIPQSQPFGALGKMFNVPSGAFPGQKQHFVGQQHHAPQPQPQAVAPVGKIFHVQVPANAIVGQQLQIQNPFTKQMMIVKIPPGVKPGGKFGVQC